MSDTPNSDENSNTSHSEISEQELNAQPLIGHLIELRNRLLRAVLAVILVFCGLYYFANDLYLFISEPLRSLMPEGTTMIATDVASPFLTPFKLTFFASIFVAMPFILFQLWRFIAPALYESERRLAMPLLFSSVMLFYGLSLIHI